MTDAYEIISWGGSRLDRMTAAALHDMEKRLDYDLTVMQGSYNGGGVRASAGTHDGGGAVDLAPFDWQRKVRVGRAIGFAMWYRPAISGLWPAHVHGILIGNAKVSSGAAAQITSYRNHRNGLADNGWDSFWRPDPIRAYQYEVEPTIGVSLKRLQVDFRTALDHPRIPNAPTRRGRIVQRCLNRKTDASLLVDGVVGPRTAAAWRRFEVSRDIITDRPGVPDARSLRRLLRGTVYFAVV